jgi:DNA modification methylase
MQSMKGCGREIGGLPCCTVIHGDCNDYLWMLSSKDIDLVVADPPYGMEYQSHRRAVLHNKIANDDSLPVDTIRQLIEIPRLASYFFCRWENLWEHGVLPLPKDVVTWVKNNHGSGDLAHGHGPRTENILFYPGVEHAFKARPDDVVFADKTDNECHPTQKPIALIRQMLLWYDFETVLDPYIGSGTTALAAMQMRKHFLGFEIDDVHFATACARINAQRGIVTADPDAKQPTLFG